jgi:hypothetical protein
MGEVCLCPACLEPVDLEKEYVVTNRATANTTLNRIYAHVSCVRGDMRPIREMSDAELDAAIAELDEKLRRLSLQRSARLRQQERPE